MNTIRLDELNNGLIETTFNKAFEEIINNIRDEKTPIDQSRSVIITLKVQPENRKYCKTELTVDTRLAITSEFPFKNKGKLYIDENGVFEDDPVQMELSVVK
jgi:hypothetical protein